MPDGQIPEDPIAEDEGIVPPQRAALIARGLTKRFGKVVAVAGIDFTVARGSACGLLGGNGAGKTTTIAMLLGLLLPSEGVITILGEDMVRHRHRVLPRLNFSSPYVDLPHRLTVRQNLVVYARLYGLDHPKARVEAMAEALQLTELLDRRTGGLSAGQKTRAALAKALINEPDILLLDEPTASLDPDTADWIRGYIADYQRRRDATILLASHNMAEVERLCDQVLMMQQGRIVDRGTPGDLVARYGRADLEGVFLAIAREGARDPQSLSPTKSPTGD